MLKFYVMHIILILNTQEMTDPSNPKKTKSSTPMHQLRLELGPSFKLVKIEPKSIPPTTSTNVSKTREFKQKWLLEFRWLEYNEEEKKMYCKWCKDDIECKNSFTKGCENFQKSSLKEHIIIDDHKKWPKSMIS